MGNSIVSRMKVGLFRSLLRHAPRRVIKEELLRRHITEFQANYGPFADLEIHEKDSVPNPLSESGRINGVVGYALRSVARPTDFLLLAGERRSSRPAYSSLSGIPVERILTAGWHEDMDFRWNYENDPPAELPQVDLIASKAMLEHLLDPSKHVRDCWGLLKPGGHLLLTTVMPGFQYHRYPIDCLRFFPDWFEETAQRLGAEIVLRNLDKTTRILYIYRKPD